MTGPHSSSPQFEATHDAQPPVPGAHPSPPVDVRACGQLNVCGPVDALAELLAPMVADLLAARLPTAQAAGDPPAVAGLVDAATVACALGISRQVVYQRADELGAVRIGDGPRARLRFDLETAIRCCGSRQSQAQNASAGAESAPTPARAKGIRRRGLPPAGSILAVRPRETTRGAER
jgi:hypothetical protein